MRRKSDRLVRTGLSVFFAVALTVTAMPVMASEHYYYSAPDVFYFGEKTGYDLGYRHGQQDFAQRRRLDFRHDRAYRDDDTGYKKEYKHKDDYKAGYRKAYEKGYVDAYYGYGFRPFRDPRDDDRSRRDRDSRFSRNY